MPTLHGGVQRQARCRGWGRRINKGWGIAPLLRRSQGSDTKPPGPPCTAVQVVSYTRFQAKSLKELKSSPQSGHQAVCYSMGCFHLDKAQSPFTLNKVMCLWSCVCTEYIFISDSQKDQGAKENSKYQSWTM